MWIMIGLAILLAIVISLVWLGTAAYLLGDVWGVVDPLRFDLPIRIAGLIAVALVPALVWLLASSVWRSSRFAQALRRIESRLTPAHEEEALRQADIVALREATESATREIGEAATSAEARRNELVEVAEPMAELASQLHGVLGEMRGFGETVEGTESTLRAMVGHVATLNEAAQPLLQLDDRLTQEQRRLQDAIQQLTESGEEAVSRLQRQARSMRQQVGALRIDEPLRLSDDRHIEGRGLKRVDFLTDARDVVAHLNDKAVDLNALMKIDTPPAVIAALTEGDHSLLLRRLPRLKDRSGVRGLVLHYRHDRTFRLAADRFMDAFEALLEDSRDADPTGGLGAVFLTSDLGRLYMALAGETRRADHDLLD